MGHLRKPGETFGMAEKEVEAAENEVYDTTNENSPVGADAGILCADNDVRVPSAAVLPRCVFCGYT